MSRGIDFDRLHLRPHERVLEFEGDALNWAEVGGRLLLLGSRGWLPTRARSRTPAGRLKSRDGVEGVVPSPRLGLVTDHPTGRSLFKLPKMGLTHAVRQGKLPIGGRNDLEGIWAGLGRG